MKEILDEYFLEETEITEKIEGWKVIGTIEDCAQTPNSTILELKTNDEGWGWLYNFRIKLLGCGLILVSPEYKMDEDGDKLIIEAVRKIFDSGLLKIKIKTEELYEKILTDPGTWRVQQDPPIWWRNSATSSGVTTYYNTQDYLTTCKISSNSI